MWSCNWKMFFLSLPPTGKTARAWTLATVGPQTSVETDPAVTAAEVALDGAVLAET